jgi:DNA-binding MarR family transcriptional regulator
MVSGQNAISHRNMDAVMTSADGPWVFDPVVHQPTRLAVLAVLSGAGEAEFRAVRDAAGVSDSVLSKQVRVLEDAGYVLVRKGHVDRRSRTWLRIGEPGRAALAAYLEAMMRVVERAHDAGRSLADDVPPGR